MDTIICKEKTEFELSQTVYCPAAMTHPLTAGAASPGSSTTAFVFGIKVSRKLLSRPPTSKIFGKHKKSAAPYSSLSTKK